MTALTPGELREQARDELDRQLLDGEFPKVPPTALTIFRYLLDFAAGDGPEFDIGIIARVNGMAARTATRALSSLEDAGLISREDDGIIITWTGLPELSEDTTGMNPSSPR